MDGPESVGVLAQARPLKHHYPVLERNELELVPISSLHIITRGTLYFIVDTSEGGNKNCSYVYFLASLFEA